MDAAYFVNIAAILTLAKALYDIDRLDVIQEGFSDVLDYDDYYINVYGVISLIFSGFENNCDEYETEIMIFKDDVISDYFVHAWEYGKKHRLLNAQNPYVTDAQNEVIRWLKVSYCVSSELLAYTKSKRTAKRSKLLIRIDNCGCDAPEKVAYGLIQLYKWFKDKCDEFKAKKAEVSAA